MNFKILQQFLEKRKIVSPNLDEIKLCQRDGRDEGASFLFSSTDILPKRIHTQSSLASDGVSWV